jgi:hypothetical protein
MRALNSALYRFRCVIICSSASTSTTQPFYLNYLSSFRGYTIYDPLGDTPPIVLDAVIVIHSAYCSL